MLVVRRLSRAVDAYTPAGVGRSLTSVGEGLRELAAAVREGMAEREDELRAALAADATPASQEHARPLLTNPTRRPGD